MHRSPSSAPFGYAERVCLEREHGDNEERIAATRRALRRVQLEIHGGPGPGAVPEARLDEVSGFEPCWSEVRPQAEAIRLERGANLDEGTTEVRIHGQVVLIDIDTIVPVASGEKHGADRVPAQSSDQAVGTVATD